MNETKAKRTRNLLKRWYDNYGGKKAKYKETALHEAAHVVAISNIGVADVTSTQIIKDRRKRITGITYFRKYCKDSHPGMLLQTLAGEHAARMAEDPSGQLDVGLWADFYLFATSSKDKKTFAGTDIEKVEQWAKLKGLKGAELKKSLFEHLTTLDAWMKDEYVQKLIIKVAEKLLKSEDMVITREDFKKMDGIYLTTIETQLGPGFLHAEYMAL